MSIKDRLRELKQKQDERRAQEAPVKHAREALKAKTPPKRGTPTVTATEMVEAKCGHLVEFQLFEDKKDKYRDQRRKKMTDRDCPACRQERERLRQEEAQKRRAEDSVSTRAWKMPKGRLPHGSHFDATYDGEAQAWTGTLTIPADPSPLVFSYTKGGVFRLMSTLDTMYRKWLIEQEDKASE